MRYMKRPTLYPIVAAIAAHDRPAALAAIASALDGEPGKHWNRDLPKLAEFIRDGAPRFTVFAEDGNGKLPFLGCRLSVAILSMFHSGVRSALVITGTGRTMWNSARPSPASMTARRSRARESVGIALRMAMRAARPGSLAYPS
jgi:hypothetical protein